MRAVVMTWAPGGNLPPMLAVASMLARRGHEVRVLASGETRDAAQRLGVEVNGYRRSPDPDVRVAFEAQADLMMATMAGAEIAFDARDLLSEVRPDVAVVDCMLPAAIAAARAAGQPSRSCTSSMDLRGRRCCEPEALGQRISVASRRLIGCLGSPPPAMASARGRHPSWCW